MVITTTASGVPKGPIWMQCPTNDQDDSIPGLAFILPLDQLIVAKRRDNLHDVIGQSGVAYTIFNSGGQKVFLAVLKKRFRQFDVTIFNIYGNEVINVKKPPRLCAKEVLVWAPPGQFLGSVRERASCISTYIVRDKNGNKVLNIRAEGLFQYVYKIYVISYGEPSIGVLQKQLPMPGEENVRVTFPKEINIKAKAVLLGACFLIWPSKN